MVRPPRAPAPSASAATGAPSRAWACACTRIKMIITIYSRRTKVWSLGLERKKAKPYPPRILSSVFFSWHLADWISEFRLISIIYLKRPENLLHPLPMGKEIYSTEPRNRIHEGKYLLHEMGNLIRHTS